MPGSACQMLKCPVPTNGTGLPILPRAIRQPLTTVSRVLIFTSFEAYWQAAMAAWRRGGKRFEGYLTTYGSPGQFQRNLQRSVSRNTPNQFRWTGPESSAGPVILTFE